MSESPATLPGLSGLIGRPVDGLPLADRLQLAGYWIAVELYSPERLPLRIIAAVGLSVRDCAMQLRNRGLDPTRYHYEALGEPFEPDAFGSERRGS